MCPICKSKNTVGLSNLPKYHYCRLCQTAWLKKLPKSSYDKGYYQGKSSLAGRLFKPLELFFYWLRQKYVGEGGGGLWIDIGAGEGSFLKSVKADRKIGVEISRVGRKQMEQMGLETMSPREFLKSKGLGASIISFWHVLEHTENPMAYLKIARKNLGPGGKIVIGVPNMASWEFKIFGQDWFHLVPEYHIWHFSPASIKKLLCKTGFKLGYIDYFSVEHHPIGLLQSFINKFSGTHNILHKLVKRETDLGSFPIKGVFWSIFWLTLGAPIVLLIWIFNSLMRRSGTFVVVAVEREV